MSNDNILQRTMTEISRTFRDIQPAHFQLKIESFSVFSSEPGFENFETDEFEAGGHKWRLRICPNRDRKSNAKNNISLYLVISDTKHLPPGWDVNAQFSFFVFDQLRDRYLTIQDGRTRRFHAMKTEWGFAKLISLDVFNNPSRGFLVDDCCVIGAEVFVNKYLGKGQCLSLAKYTQDKKYTWKINNFSSVKEELLCSPEFIIGERMWSLRLYPEGNSAGAKVKSLSLFLNLHVTDDATQPPNWKTYANYKLRIRNQVSENHIEKKGGAWFDSLKRSWGFAEYMLLTDLNDKSKGYVVNDTVIIETVIELAAVHKAFS